MIRRIARIDNISPKKMERITWLFPEELCGEKILMNNIKNTKAFLKEYSYELDQIKTSEKILKELKFDIQKEEQRKVLNSHIKTLKEIKGKINENISPYFWNIIQDVNDQYGHCFGEPIIVDYVLCLEKDMCHYDE